MTENNSEHPRIFLRYDFREMFAIFYFIVESIVKIAKNHIEICQKEKTQNNFILIDTPEFVDLK